MSSTVKTFRAADARTALARVKAELGPDAVIVAARELPGGVLRRSEVEVTAALPAAPAPRPQAYLSAVSAPPIPPAPLETVEQRAARLPAAVRAPSPAPAAPAPRAVAPAPDPELGNIRAELEALRRQLATREGHRAAPLEGLPAAATDVFERLVRQGIEDALAEELVRQAVSDRHPQGIAARVRELVREQMVAGRAPWLRDRPRVIALVGPTGVGKTTTLAKIAARAVMESRLSVALVTVDTYRIGACEQVARYGEIMNVPTFVAKDRAELQSALGRCAGRDLVLIDTAGRSLSEAVARQAELVRLVPGTELFLVASAATGARELAAVADRYRPLAPDRVVLTKVDEAVAPGSALSLSVRLGRPVACIADGQQVPENLHAASTEGLSELVLGDALRPLKAAGNVR